MPCVPSGIFCHRYAVAVQSLKSSPSLRSLNNTWGNSMRFSLVSSVQIIWRYILFCSLDCSRGFWGPHLSIHFVPYMSYFSLFDQVFCHERKWYNRKELAQHRAHGDPDDTSHRGHPLCKFCDDRYLDNDELLKHLRRDHYFCHFCDADGSQEYYRQVK